MTREEWEVELAVSGPITVKRAQPFDALKGTQDPFLTTVEISKARDGVKIKIVARAESSDGANDAAAFFVGQAVDVLSLRLNLPLYMNLFKPEFRTEQNHVKRIVTQKEWQEAFGLGRKYVLKRPVFSRALTWYRKGLVGENPVDQLLAYWAALESISSKFHENNARTTSGTINQICNCFDLLWENVENWKVIANDPNAVNQFCDLRNGIAHGAIRVDVEKIKQIIAVLPKYHELTREFLLDWEINGRRFETKPLLSNTLKP